ncbi:hypothetical protein J1C67_12370 [Clostridium gasigenes]|uniref:hypothetical protein n=1 Tax=Clostridium gasigenes TaxID=94869 RepID=UPI0014383FF7|nr:hypothetical protein [Clostridium gasigenes]NKF07377.1 hypothetical protein [Clostridium gasigenes]QSW18344.1 hypothetical protein J1C67_12370 [Clostridium gasigenes]
MNIYINNRQGFNNLTNHKSNEKKVIDKSIKAEDIKDNKNSTLKKLEEWKENLIIQKGKLQEEKEMDPELKKNRMKQINEEINQVQQQIQEIKLIEKEKEIRERNEKSEGKKQERDINKDEVRDGIIIASSLNKLIDANNNLKNSRNLRTTKTNMEMELGYLKQGNSDSNFVAKQKEKLTTGIGNLEFKAKMQVAESIRNVNKNEYKAENTIKKETLINGDDSESEKSNENKVNNKKEKDQNEDGIKKNEENAEILNKQV